MNLYRLGAMPWAETQAIYHVLAQTKQEGLVICRPSARCVCLGLHDDLEQEVDRAYCRENNIPLIRRDIGGGMVLLDKGQIFFQLVLHSGNPLLSGKRADFFMKFLAPVVKTLGEFNVQAAIKYPADIVVHGKKISGNGAGDINGFAVYTGNILISFDRITMANVLNLPNVYFREFTRLSMERCLTTLEEELGWYPDIETIEERLIANFSAWITDLGLVEYSEELNYAVKMMARKLTSQEFLNLPGKNTAVRQIKINEGTYLRLHFFRGCGQTKLVCQEDCNYKRGEADLGYAILLIQDGKIQKFESYGLACLGDDGIVQLTSHLLGVSWCEPDIGAAVARWRQSRAAAGIAIADEMLTSWILCGSENRRG